MEIIDKYSDEKIRVQFHPIPQQRNEKSKSFTVRGVNVAEAFERILFYFEQLSRQGEVKITCFKHGKTRTESD